MLIVKIRYEPWISNMLQYDGDENRSVCDVNFAKVTQTGFENQITGVPRVTRVSRYVVSSSPR